MSRIEQLIEELCSDGVEWKELGECLVRTKGTPITAQQMSEINKEGAPIKIFAGGKTVAYVNYGDIPEKDILTKKSIVVKSRGIIEFEYIEKPFSHKNEFWSYHSDSLNVNIKYVYFYLKSKETYFQTIGQRMSKMPQLSISDTDKFSIPIPPLPIQQEIVRILDTFTDLDAELQAELEARKKQYEFYREQLFNFEGKEVEWKTLGDIADVTKLAGFEFTAHIKYADKGSIIALRGMNVKNGSLDLSNVKYIDDSNFSKLTRSKLLMNDMLFTYVGTIGDVALIDKNDRYYLAPNVSRIRFLTDKVIPRLMMYYFQTFSFKEKQIEKYLAYSSLKNLSMENIRKFQIPIPPLSEQGRIVSILDKFEALVNVELPAEIAARRKQYEYYRERLLTFEPLVNSFN